MAISVGDILATFRFDTGDVDKGGKEATKSLEDVDAATGGPVCSPLRCRSRPATQSS